MRKDLVMLAAGLFLLPWIAVLWGTLPDAYPAQHWRAAWMGFDAAEALGMLTSAWLLRRGDPRAPFAAISTATLLLADAWFDVMTAGDDVVFSLLLAIGLELPLAAFCVRAALQALPRPVVRVVPAYV